MGRSAPHATNIVEIYKMKLESTPIKGLFVLHRPVHRDSRGQFTRLFAVEGLASAGRQTEAVHVNTSTSAKAGTLRGIHFQYPPYAEAKIVACTAGAIWDVGVDLRPESPTRFQWFGVKLTPDNGLSMVIPEGCGHAFITLEPNSTAVYVVSAVYAVDHESGIRYDDEMLAIKWPILPTVQSDKDLDWGQLKSRIDELDSGFSTL
jgi:dTDP-4-dehydrorhamnose 3,5-epimerase